MKILEILHIKKTHRHLLDLPAMMWKIEGLFIGIPGHQQKCGSSSWESRGLASMLDGKSMHLIVKTWRFFITLVLQRVSRWWFQIFVYFHPGTLGTMNPFWRSYFFKGVETTNQVFFPNVSMSRFPSPEKKKKRQNFCQVSVSFGDWWRLRFAVLWKFSRLGIEPMATWMSRWKLVNG